MLQKDIYTASKTEQGSVLLYVPCPEYAQQHQTVSAIPQLKHHLFPQQYIKHSYSMTTVKH